MHGLKGDEARATENKTTLEQKLKAYESILSKQKYIGGDVSTSIHSRTPFSNRLPSSIYPAPYDFVHHINFSISSLSTFLS